MNEQVKAEALKRIGAMGLHPDVATFLKEGTVYYSERSPMGGILYWLDNEPEWEAKIREVEEQYGIHVYHATHEYTAFGETLTLLYVSESEEDWEWDLQDLTAVPNKEYGWTPYAYVLNLTDPWCSEFGRVGVRELAGGLVRTA